MRTPILLTLAVCLLAAGIIGFLLLSDPPADPPQEVELRVDSGKVLVTRDGDREIVMGGEGITADTDGLLPKSAPPTPVPTAAPVAVAEPEVSAATEELPATALELRLVDALGDPIRNGSVSVDGTVREPQGGRFLVENLKPGAVEVVASADGYRSATRTVDIPAVRDLTLTLEYECTVQVLAWAVDEWGNAHEEKGHPVANAEVFLWEGTRVSRPVRKEARAYQINYRRSSAEPFRARFGKSGAEVIAVEDSGKNDGLAASGFSSNNINVGDVVVGISGCMWDENARTKLYMNESGIIGTPEPSRLRVWDALSLIGRGTLLNQLSRSVSVDIVRDGDRRTGPLHGWHVSTRGKLLKIQRTDQRGVCTFNGLPPGVYYAQVHKGDLRSEIGVFHPGINGLKLRMAEKASLRLSVKRSGQEDMSLAYVRESEITLTRENEDGARSRFMGRTTNGHWSESVPWGTYTLTVNPTEENELPPKTVTVVVEDLFQRLTINYDEVGNSRIAGIVNATDGQGPVAGFPIQLRKRGHHRSWGKVASAVTGEDGLFAFDGLDSGWYQLHKNKRAAKTSTRYVLDGSKREIEIRNEDIEDIELVVTVTHLVETTLQGIVVTESGEPVPEAEIGISNSSEYKMLSNPRETNADGTFEIRLAVEREKGVLSEALYTCLKKKVDKGKGRVDFDALYNGWPLNPGELPTALGASDVQFSPGDTVAGIELVLRDSDAYGSICGEISTEDGGWPVPVRIEAHQSGRRLEGRINEDGFYRIDWVSPGRVWMGTYIPSFSGAGPPSDRPKKPYSNVNVELEMPSELTTLTADLVLPCAGHLSGIVLDENHDPLPDVRVIVRGENLFRYRYSWTDGTFLIDGLDRDKEYSVEALLDDKQEPSVRIGGLTVPIENVILQVAEDDR